MDREISGNIIDIPHRKIYPGRVIIQAGLITDITPLAKAQSRYLLPGFIDAHIHIESSMLVPAEFARLAVVHGTVATVSDPHEIANVLGTQGVDYMINNGALVPFKFYFGAPSCVPATSFETAGATIGSEEVKKLLVHPKIKYLAEMMNWPGVLDQDPEVMAKIKAAIELGKPVDGHAPGLRSNEAKAYASAGITTDHECFTMEEALDKLACGMKIIIREGSAAKNFEALIDLLPDHYNQVMFCSDDKHPDNLVEGHINLLVKRALAKGHDLFKVLQAACINPINHYGLEVGKLSIDQPADLIVIDDLQNFNVLQTYIDGQLVAEQGRSLIERQENEIVNQFSCSPKTPNQFEVAAKSGKAIAIQPFDGQLITDSLPVTIEPTNGILRSDTTQDLLKITVVNRYKDAAPAVGLIYGFGLKQGALASSVAHDSHNIIAVGADDESLCEAVNAIIDNRGGVAAVYNGSKQLVPLPVAGLMSADDGYEVASSYTAIDSFVKELGCELEAPFMTLSFMALLVIPKLKLSDKGLFDGERFEFVDLFEETSA
ncbi:MAG: adenine deaminase [Cyclobacteriaceae bacterium]